MKNINVLLGIGMWILLLVGMGGACVNVTVYTDDFSDSVVNYKYWTNLTGGVIWSETGGYMKIVHGVGIPSHSRYSLDTGNSQLLLDARLQYYTGNPPRHASMFFWDGKYGVQCWATKLSTTYYLHCRAVPAYASMECNTFSEIIVHQGASNPSHNYRFSTALNQLNFSIDGVLEIQCNNTFQNDFSDVKLEFIQNDTPQSTFEAYIYDFAHGNKTNYHENIWTARNWYTGEPLKDVNISIENVTHSAPPIPQSCVTGSDGRCSFLYDYDCNIPCDCLIHADVSISDTEIYPRFTPDNYKDLGIGRDHIHSPFYIWSNHRVYLSSHMVEFDIQDYSHNPLNNAYVEAENVIGAIHYCITNSSGKCKMLLLSNSTYTMTIEGGYKYFTKTETLLLSPYVSYNLNQSYFLDTYYMNDVNLTLTIKDATDGIINYNGTIKIEYVYGDTSILGFNWKIPIVNGTGNYFGLPQGRYEVTIFNKTDYYFYRYSEEEELGDYYDFFLEEFVTVEEARLYYVKYWSGAYNVSGRVLCASNWTNWDNNIFNGINETEVTFSNQYYTYTRTTDNQGFFAFSNMKAGEYHVLVMPSHTCAVYQEIRLVDENTEGLRYYLKPNLPEPVYNISIYGYVTFNNTIIPSLSIRVRPERGSMETIYTNSEGFYNWSREWYVPQTITMIFNYDSHLNKYETKTIDVFLTRTEKTKEKNVSLEKKILWWEVIGSFKDSDNNFINCDWIIKKKGFNETIRSGFNENVFHVYDLEPDVYIMYVSGDFIGGTQKQFELPNNYEYWDVYNGLFDLGTIYVNPIVDFYTYYFTFKEITQYEGYHTEMTVDDVTINFKGVSIDYEVTVNADNGYHTLENLPSIDYILTISKTGYNTHIETGFMGNNKNLYLEMTRKTEEVVNEVEFWNWLGTNVYSFAQVIIMLFLLYIMSQLLTGIAGGG